MTKITIELEDNVVERLAIVSRAYNLTVEQWLRAEAEKAARLEKTNVIENASHRAILLALEHPKDYCGSPRDEMLDRENARARSYQDARQALLDLIDNTQGDMGTQTWNRSALYAS